VLDATSPETTGAKPPGLVGLACTKGMKANANAAPKEKAASFFK